MTEGRNYVFFVQPFLFLGRTLIAADNLEIKSVINEEFKFG